MRPIPDIAVSFIQKAEACKLVGYADSAGKATVGYGHVSPDIHVGMIITQQQADGFLKLDLMTAAIRLGSVVVAPVIADLTDNQYAALISFVFNLGCNPIWTIWKLLNARSFDQVPAEMQRFVSAGKPPVKIEGLVNRRAAETVLWSTSEPGSIPETISSSVTRNSPTPPTPTVAATQPLAKSKSFVATAATAILAVAAPLIENAKGAIQAINDAVTPYVGSSEILQHLTGSLTIGLAVLAVATVFLGWLKNHEDKML